MGTRLKKLEAENRRLKTELELYKHNAKNKRAYTQEQRIDILIADTEKICAEYEHDEKSIMSFYNKQTTNFAKLVKEYQKNNHKHYENEIRELKQTFIFISDKYHDMLINKAERSDIHKGLEQMTNLFQRVKSGVPPYPANTLNLNTETKSKHDTWGIFQR